MVQHIRCPSCNRTLRIAEHLSGRPLKCPSCSEKFTAPAASGSESPIGAAIEADDQKEPDFGQREARHGEGGDRSGMRRPTSSEPSVGQGRPGKVQAIAIMTLIGGILALLHGLVLLAYIGFVALTTLGLGLACCLWPGPYYSLVLGIMAIIKGAALLGGRAHLQTAPKAIAIMQIINIVNCDIPNLVMGIISLIFLSEPEVSRYFRSQT